MFDIYAYLIRKYAWKYRQLNVSIQKHESFYTKTKSFTRRPRTEIFHTNNKENILHVGCLPRALELVPLYTVRTVTNGPTSISSSDYDQSCRRNRSFMLLASTSRWLRFRGEQFPTESFQQFWGKTSSVYISNNCTNAVHPILTCCPIHPTK